MLDDASQQHMELVKKSWSIRIENEFPQGKAKC